MAKHWERLGKYTSLNNGYFSGPTVYLNSTNSKIGCWEIYECPLCHRRFSEQFSHSRFECDWLGAIVTFSFGKVTIYSYVTRVDTDNETIYLAMHDDDMVPFEMGASPKKLNDLYILERSVSPEAKAKGLKRGMSWKGMYCFLKPWTYLNFLP
jgi:hypothetical protein